MFITAIHIPVQRLCSQFIHNTRCICHTMSSSRVTGSRSQVGHYRYHLKASFLWVEQIKQTQKLVKSEAKLNLTDRCTDLIQYAPDHRSEGIKWLLKLHLHLFIFYISCLFSQNSMLVFTADPKKSCWQNPSCPNL